MTALGARAYGAGRCTCLAGPGGHTRSPQCCRLSHRNSGRGRTAAASNDAAPDAAAGPAPAAPAAPAAAAPAPAPAPAPAMTAAAAAAAKQRVIEQFNRRAAGYDQDNTYHPPLASRLLELASPQAGESVLDLATGTGLVALWAALAVGRSGRVVGVDICEAMLQQARAKPLPQGAAQVEWLQGDIEQLDLPPHTFDIITCSAAVPFVTDISKALASWRTLLHPQRGRLVFNSFQAPAVLDFGTFINVARQWGVQVVDPCEVVGSENALRTLLQQAGYSRVQVQTERKERWYQAESPVAYAEAMYQQGVGNNPFSPITADVMERQLWLTFHAAVLDAIVDAVEAEGRWVEGRGVRSPHTVLNVQAFV